MVEKLDGSFQFQSNSSCRRIQEFFLTAPYRSIGRVSSSFDGQKTRATPPLGKQGRPAKSKENGNRLRGPK